MDCTSFHSPLFGGIVRQFVEYYFLKSYTEVVQLYSSRGKYGLEKVCTELTKQNKKLDADMPNCLSVSE